MSGYDLYRQVLQSNVTPSGHPQIICTPSCNDIGLETVTCINEHPDHPMKENSEWESSSRSFHLPMKENSEWKSSSRPMKEKSEWKSSSRPIKENSEWQCIHNSLPLIHDILYINPDVLHIRSEVIYNMEDPYESYVNVSVIDVQRSYDLPMVILICIGSLMLVGSLSTSFTGWNLF